MNKRGRNQPEKNVLDTADSPRFAAVDTSIAMSDKRLLDLGSAPVYVASPRRWTQLGVYCCASFLCAMPWSIMARSHNASGAAWRKFWFAIYVSLLYFS